MAISRWTWGAAALTLPALLAFPQGYLGREHDDALYVLAAQSLARGEYRQWYLPGAPPLTATTPGLPLLLAPAAAAAPDALWLYQFLCALMLAAAGPLLWVWFRRRGSGGVAAGLFAFSPLVLSRAGVVMPEPAFLLAALGALFSLERGGAWTGGALAVAYLIRPAALPLWAAAWTVLFLGRRFRDLGGAAGIPLATLGLWALWSRAGGGVAETLELKTLFAHAGPGVFFQTLAANARHMADTLGATFLPLAWAAGPAAMPLGFGLMALALRGVARSWSGRTPEAGDLFWVFSLGMHLLWPWWYDRYWLPLLPFLLDAAWRGLPISWRTPHPKRARAVAAALGAAVFLSQGIFLLRAAGRAVPEQRALYEWIQTSTNAADGFASPFYARDLLYTGRVFQPLPDAATPAEWRDTLQRRRVRYVLWPATLDPGLTMPHNPLERQLGEMAAWLREGRLFRAVHADERGTVYAVDGAPV